MKDFNAVLAKMRELQADLDAIKEERTPLVQAYSMRRTQEYTPEQDARLLELTKQYQLVKTRLGAIEWVFWNERTSLESFTM